MQMPAYLWSMPDKADHKLIWFSRWRKSFQQLHLFFLHLFNFLQAWILDFSHSFEPDEFTWKVHPVLLANHDDRHTNLWISGPDSISKYPLKVDWNYNIHCMCSLNHPYPVAGHAQQVHPSVLWANKSRKGLSLVPRAFPGQIGPGRREILPGSDRKRWYRG